MKKSFIIPFIVIIISGIIGGYFLFTSNTNPNKNQIIQSKNLRKLSLKIEGMYCLGCERSIESSVGSMKGVKKTKVSLKTNSGTVVYNSQKTNKNKIKNNSIFDTYPATIKKDQKYKN